MTTGPKIARKDLKEDKVYLTMAEILDFAVRYRLTIALTALGVIAALAFAYYMSVRSARNSTDASWALYQVDYVEDSSGRVPALEKIMTDYRGTQAARFAEFSRANAFYESGEFEEALAAYEKFLKKNPGHLLAPSAIEAVGFCRESLGLWLEATKTYEGIIQGGPTAPIAARVSYRLGLCSEKLEEKEKAVENYEKVIELSPGSLWADDALQRLEILKPQEYAASKAEPSSSLLPSLAASPLAPPFTPSPLAPAQQHSH
jgi:tetratricopeptide (TPR) repeat protein